MSTPETTLRDGQKLWLWRNGDHFLAFDQEYPTHDGNDPMTLGEPVGVALFRCSDPPAQVEIVTCPKCGAQGMAFICDTPGCPVNGGAAHG